jgi:hypothetical protein
VHRRAITYPERWLPLNGYICFGCLTMGIDNQLVTALGAYAIWTFAGFIPIHYLLSLLSANRRAPELGILRPAGG